MSILEQLHSPNPYQRLTAVEANAKSRPRVEDIAALRFALQDEWDAVARCAARALGKLGPKAHEAVEDLVACATRPWVFGCPQRFPDAIGALLRIAPHHPRLVAICQDALTCQNYGIQKAAIVALAKIATPEAISILRDIDRHRDTTIQGKLFDRLMEKVLGGLQAPAPVG